MIRLCLNEESFEVGKGYIEEYEGSCVWRLFSAVLNRYSYRFFLLSREHVKICLFWLRDCNFPLELCFPLLILYSEFMMILSLFGDMIFLMRRWLVIRYWYSSWMCGRSLGGSGFLRGKWEGLLRLGSVLCGKYWRYVSFIFYFSIHYKWWFSILDWDWH